MLAEVIVKVHLHHVVKGTQRDHRDQGSFPKEGGAQL